MISPSLQTYKKLLLLRKCEEKIIEHYFEDDMKTPMHMSMGSEAISVGVCSALTPLDKVFGTYRSHALFLSRTNDHLKFFLELYGKADGICRGKAGSMHLSSIKHGHFGASAVVASTIPLAAGTAFAEKYNNSGGIAAVFFGDGAIDEGVFWETINISSLKGLPLLFVCEDNKLAVHTILSERHSFDIDSAVKAFGCNVYSSKSTDADEIHSIASEAITQVRKDSRPCFLHLEYYRYLEHVGVEYDFDAGYRDEKEFLQWKENDPISLYRKKLTVPENELLEIEAIMAKEIERSISTAQSSSFSDVSELYDDVYARE